MVGYYFDKKRALATGIAVCGSGIGTFVFAPFGTFLVDEFGWKGANIIFGALILNGVVFGAIFRPLEVARIVVIICFTVTR
jgi:predicted MFS family arabinose efflux permease